LATHSKLHSTVQVSSASLASVEVALTDFQNWLQKTNKQKTNKQTAVFIELLPQLKFEVILYLKKIKVIFHLQKE
jgi:hypothetical protein